MTIRRTLFAVLATTVLAAGPALADGPHKGGLTLLPATSSSNSVQSHNTAAGIGNKAGQHVQVIQSGQSGYGWKKSPTFSTNQVHSGNTAAGIGNKAYQGVGVMQQGTKGAFSSFNSVASQNTAAGIFNRADQNIFVQQK